MMVDNELEQEKRAQEDRADKFYGVLAGAMLNLVAIWALFSTLDSRDFLIRNLVFIQFGYLIPADVLCRALNAPKKFRDGLWLITIVWTVLQIAFMFLAFLTLAIPAHS